MTNNKHNSFYKGENAAKKNNTTIKDFQYKKYLKIGGKLFKWMIFIFLAITTLWGCVQEFTIKSSPYLAQGMETYQDSAHVLPNLYYVNKDYVYISSENENYISGDQNINQKYQLNSFPNIYYPTYSIDDQGVPIPSTVHWTTYEQALEESKDTSDKVSAFSPLFGFNASLYDVSLWSSIFWYDNSTYIDSLQNSGKIFIPYYNTTEKAYKTTTSIDANGTPISEQSIARFGKYDEYDMTNLTNEDIQSLQNLQKQLLITNVAGYLSNSSKSADSIIIYDSNGEAKTLQSQIDFAFSKIEQSQTIPTQVKNDFSKYTSTNGGYESLDFSIIFNAPSSNSNFSSGKNGIATYVPPMQKNNPLSPTQETYDYLYKEDGISEIRVENWNSLSPGNLGDQVYDSHSDSSISNAGWLFMDTDGNRIQLKDSNGNPIYLQAQKITDELGDKDTYAGNYSSINNLIKVANEQSFTTSISSNTKYKISLNSQSYTVDLSSIVGNYIGFSSINYYNGKAADGANPIVTPEQSIFDSGQKKYNESRIAIETWGEAWTYGPFYGMFVYPISIISNWLSNIFNYEQIHGWAVIFSVFFIVFLFRGLASLISLKSTRNQQKMQEVQFKVAQINAKYEMYKDNKNMKQRKQMEVMALYKKEGVNPLSSLGNLFLTLPIFLAMWTIISTLPLYKIASFGPLLLSVSPFYGIFNLFFATAGLYLLIGITVGMIQFVSYKLPTHLAQKRQGIKNIDLQTKTQLKKNQKVMNIMMIVFVVIGLTIPALLSIYWIFSSLFTIIQTLIQHGLDVRRENKAREASN